MNTDINYTPQDIKQLDEIVGILKSGMSLECDKYQYDQRLYKILVSENLVEPWGNTGGYTTIQATANSPIMLDPSWTFSRAYDKADKERMVSPIHIDNSQTTIIGNNNKIKDKKHNQQCTSEIERQSIWSKVISTVSSCLKLN